MIGKTIKRFEIQSALGAGGMGKVYLARDTKLNRQVALKFISADLQSDAFRKRFMHEAQAIAALNHPNVVTIYEIDEYENQPFIVLEHVDGQSLETLLGDGGLEKTRALEIVRDVAHGLAAAHGVGVIHRDIKPSNIIITNDGRAKILDFGLARLAGATRLTQAETTLGTLHYRSPEQVGGDNSDHRSDLFSLGAVLYEALTGEVPFGGEYEAAVVYSIAHEAPAELRKYAPQAADLQPLIDRALAKDPKERFQTAAEFGEAVEAALSGRASTVTTRAKSVVPWSRVVVATAIVITALSLWQGWRLLSDGASGAEPRLALLAMENLADPADDRQLGRIALSLLATDLADAGRLQIIDPQRISDALRKHGHDLAEINDPPVRQQILDEVRATLALQGTILQVTPRLILTASLVDAINDKTIALKRITGAEGENIFEIVDRLTDSLKLALSLPIDTAGVSVSEKTTYSEEAYREYLRGMDLQLQFFDDRAQEHFERALAIDSTFAMAHYGISLSRFVEQEYQSQHIQSAVEHMSGTTRKNQYLIRARAAALADDRAASFAIYDTLLQTYPDDKLALYFYGISLGRASEWRKTRDVFRRVVAIDPKFADGYVRLGYAHYWLGEVDSSLALMDSAIAAEPSGNPNVYDSKGEIACWVGDVDLAIESFKQALEVSPTFGTRWSLADLYALIGEHILAESLYIALTVSEPIAWLRTRAREKLAALPLLRGDIDGALAALNDAIAADKFD
ncbi:MAG TPA: protein kinase, partial [candidate division Zixibacteria bacterium]|nr:protein kinase [candidate division Zixibacteria bacterium]